MSDQIDVVIIEREKQHGSYRKTAAIAQRLKAALDTGNLTPEHAEALQMICTKMARICSGDPLELDHWRDIQGYALLARHAAERERGLPWVIKWGPTGNPTHGGSGGQ